MDEFTNPPESAYITGKIFLLLQGGTSYKAVAFGAKSEPLIVAAYTIIVQFAFVGLWKLLVSLLVWLYPADNRIRIVGLVALWNSPDPWTALVAMGSYVMGVLSVRRGGNQTKKNKNNPVGNQNNPVGNQNNLVENQNNLVGMADLLRAVFLFVAAALVTLGTLAISVSYQTWLVVGHMAPVRPEALYLPRFPIGGDALKWASALRPSVLRAFGNAEATDFHSEKGSYFFLHLDGGDEQQEIQYGYNLTAADFGLQRPLGFELRVAGRCQTEYNWTHPSEDPTIPTDELYHLWGEDQPGRNIPVPGNDSSYLGQLQLYTATPAGPIFENSFNYTFAFIIASSGVGSRTSSTDPWYATEPVSNLRPEMEKKYQNLGADFRVKPGRPALSCVEENKYCLDDRCYNFQELTTGTVLQPGLQIMVSAKLSLPQIYHLALYGGVNSLRSAIGSNLATIIDAESATMTQEIERLVLAGYLSTKQIFRDVALMDKKVDYDNFLLDPRGGLFAGAADISLRTSSVTTFRLSLLIFAPVMLAAILLLKYAPAALEKCSRSHCMARQTALSATQIFRIMDEGRPESNHSWDREFHRVPMPSVFETGREPMVIQSIEYIENKKHQRSTITYNHGADDGGNVPDGTELQENPSHGQPDPPSDHENLSQGPPPTNFEPQQTSP